MAKEIYLESNKGGNYIRIAQTKAQEKEEVIDLEIGHCCVIIVRAEVPTSLLTDIFHYMLIEENRSLGELGRLLFRHDKAQHNEKLIAQIREGELF